MVYCIIALLLSIIIGLITLKTTSDEDSALNSGAAILLIMMAIAGINNFVGIEDKNFTRTAYEISSLEIANLQKVEGAFILGTGYISNSSDINYVYIANTEYGKQLKTINATKIYLVETNNETPKLIEEVTQQVRKMNWIDKLWGTDAEEQIVLEKVQKQILIIPENTIKLTYNIEI